jgi:signal peptidase I
MTACIVVVSCVAAAALGLLILMRRQFLVVSVTGKSMLPSFQPGDRLLVRRGAVARRLRTGTVAVLLEPFPSAGRSAAAGSRSRAATARPAQLIIKRVAALPGAAVPESVREAAGGTAVVPGGMIVTLADNPAGTDSRYWGLVPVSDVIGCVAFRLSSRDTGPGL